jgi:hypothetical protein
LDKLLSELETDRELAHDDHQNAAALWRSYDRVKGFGEIPWGVLLVLFATAIIYGLIWAPFEGFGADLLMIAMLSAGIGVKLLCEIEADLRDAMVFEENVLRSIGESDDILDPDQLSPSDLELRPNQATAPLPLPGFKAANGRPAK